MLQVRSGMFVELRGLEMRVFYSGNKSYGNDQFIALYVTCEMIGNWASEIHGPLWGGVE